MRRSICYLCASICSNLYVARCELRAAPSLLPQLTFLPANAASSVCLCLALLIRSAAKRRADAVTAIDTATDTERDTDTDADTLVS